VPATVNPRLSLLLNKVPEVTAIFWVIKILSTTVGETGADYLAVHVGLGASATTVIMVGFLVAALALQLRARSYVPWIYWLTVVLVSVVGTQITDLFILATEALGLGFQLGVVAFGALIALIALAYNLGANPVLTFWLGYVLTRPLGASLGDLLSQSRTYGGLGLGTIYTSIGFLTVIVALVAWVSFEGERNGKTDPVR